MAALANHPYNKPEGENTTKIVENGAQPSTQAVIRHMAERIK